jgi:xylan 1,4-beta-xylosidase
LNTLLIIIYLAFILMSCRLRSTEDKVPEVTERSYLNPIIPGFYPDPSICKVDDNYYLVNSTFSFFPGIPVFQSKDLVNWIQIGHVLDRPEQLNLDGLNISQGIFAPTIRYNKGTFYMITTLVGKGGNFLVTADKPEGPWSEPVWLPDVTGIDPSFFFDDNGKSYIVFNSEPPDNISLYDGHRAIWMYEFDTGTKKTFGEKHLLVNGGTDITKKPIWIEGPHLFKLNKYYYLIAAEGGTGINHSEVVFRSEDIKGPYISYEKNPVLTQRHLDINREYPVTCTGHADLVQLPGGDWWAVFLGCRPYEKNFFNTGRETFLVPVKWVDKWPVLNYGFETVKFSYPAPQLKEHKWDNQVLNGNFTIRDEFENEELDLAWIFIRTVREQWYSLKLSPGNLRIKLRPEVIWGKYNPSFVGRRQQHVYCHASAALTFNPVSENESAGIAAFQNRRHFYCLCKTLRDNKEVVQLVKGKGQLKTNADINSNDNIELIKEIILEKNETNRRLYLKIKASGSKYSFFYSAIRGEWKPIAENVDGKYLSTEVAGGFVGTILGMYASSDNKPSENYADLDWFEYSGNDPVYNIIK